MPETDYIVPGHNLYFNDEDSASGQFLVPGHMQFVNTASDGTPTGDDRNVAVTIITGM